MHCLRFHTIILFPFQNVAKVKSEKRGFSLERVNMHKPWKTHFTRVNFAWLNRAYFEFHVLHESIIILWIVDTPADSTEVSEASVVVVVGVETCWVGSVVVAAPVPPSPKIPAYTIPIQQQGVTAVFRSEVFSVVFVHGVTPCRPWDVTPDG